MFKNDSMQVSSVDDNVIGTSAINEDVEMNSMLQMECKNNLMSKLANICKQENPSLNYCDDFMEHMKKVDADLMSVITENHCKLFNHDFDVRIKKTGVHFLPEGSSENLVLSTEAARLLFYYTVDLYFTNQSGVPILRTTIVRSDIPALRILLKRGASTSRGGGEKFPPLHYARTAECARLLLDYGADPSEKNYEGHTLLFEIFTNISRMQDDGEKAKTIKHLLKADADIEDAMECLLRGGLPLKIENLRELMMLTAARKINQYLSLTEDDLEKLHMKYPLFTECVRDLLLIHSIKIKHLSLIDFLVKDTNILMEALRNKKISSLLKSIVKGQLQSLKMYKGYLTAKLICLITRSTLENTAAKVLCDKLSSFCYNYDIAYAILQSMNSEDIKNFIRMDENAYAKMQDELNSEQDYYYELLNYIYNINKFSKHLNISDEHFYQKTKVGNSMLITPRSKAGAQHGWK